MPKRKVKLKRCHSVVGKGAWGSANGIASLSVLGNLLVNAEGLHSRRP